VHQLLSSAGLKCGKITRRVRKPDVRTGKVYKGRSFWVQAHPYWTTLRGIFYIETLPRGTKIIPSNIGTYLTSIDLAYWIMDDGNFTGLAVELNTHGYTYDEVVILSNVINNKAIGVRNPDQFIIYIPAKDMSLLRSLIAHHMRPGQLYRLGL
jgi:hypothetical protein